MNNSEIQQHRKYETRFSRNRLKSQTDLFPVKLTMTLDFRVSPEQLSALVTSSSSKARMAGALTADLREINRLH